MYLAERFLETSIGQLGRFECPRTHPMFHELAIAKGHLMVFPREPVAITQQKRPPVVASPNVVLLYNRGVEYRRQQISEFGDRCDFLDIKEDILINSIGRFAPGKIDNLNRPFPFTHSLISARLFLEQRRLFEFAGANGADATWAISETSLHVVDQVIEQVLGVPATVTAKVSARNRELAFETLKFLCRNFHRNLKLDQIAAFAGCSHFHLSRVFRNEFGSTIHQSLMQLRLRAALERIESGCRNLTQVALDLGFNSHSHFTGSFLRAFSITPSQWRKSRANGSCPA